MSHIQPTPDNTHGLLFDAVVISSALYGAGCLQAWFYFRKFRLRDPAFVQGIVGFVLMCDTVQMALLSASVYKYLVTNHGSPEKLNVMEKTLLVELFFSGGIAIGTQMFYAWRIYILSKSWILAGIVAALGWTSYLVLFVYTIIVLKYEFLSDLLSQVPMSTTLNAFGAACDVAITVIMVLYLERSKTGFKKSTDMINRLIIFTFNTGIPTTICALCSLIFLNAIPNTFLYIFFYLIMGRFYTNSLLVTLNSRDYIRDGTRSSGVESSNEISLTGFGTAGRVATHPGARPPQEISIRIDTSRQHDGSDSKDYPDDHASNGKSLPV